MATLLTLLRHGQTELNRENRIQGRGIDAPLNETGLDQAIEAGFAVRSLGPVDVVVASSLMRARQTAEAAAGSDIESIPAMPEFDEMDYGDFEGILVDEQKGALADLYAAWARGEVDLPPPGGGESPVQVRDRAWPALRRLLDRHEGRHILVVTHGRVIRILVTVLAGMDLTRMQEIPHANGGFYHFDIDGDRIQVLRRNQTDHLTHVHIHE
jgi:broad specificity phosphatase PhoE